MIKVIISFPEGYNQCKWMKQVLEIQEKQGFITIKKISTYTIELKEPNMPSYLLSSEWIKEEIT
jgi:hypothetical protein